MKIKHLFTHEPDDEAEDERPYDKACVPHVLVMDQSQTQEHEDDAVTGGAEIRKDIISGIT